jgi:ribosome recycling factor
MSADVRENAEMSMEEAIDNVRGRLSRIRTGKATPAILDGVKVDYYGAMTPLNQLATVAAPVQAGNLGVNPSSDGMMIRIQIPELTEDSRKDLGKQASNFAEEGKIAVRKVRQEANDILKKEQKDGDITEDELHGDRDAVQKLTDRFCEAIDKIVAEKQTEIMEL